MLGSYCKQLNGLFSTHFAITHTARRTMEFMTLYIRIDRALLANHVTHLKYGHVHGDNNEPDYDTEENHQHRLKHGG